MDIEDKELFESATNDEPIEVAAEEPVAEVNDGPARDEQGRFAPKEPEPVAEAQTDPTGEATPPKEGWIPSFRVREERERAEAAERRAREIEMNFTRQIAELQAKLPKQESAKAPDVFEDPNAFLQHGVQQAVDPIKSEIGQLREFYSRREAIREHGQDKVNAAYKAVADGMQSRDPETMAVYQRAMSSMDPFGEIVSWHQQKTVVQQVGNDPNAWFEKELEKRLSDPQFAAAQLQRIQSGVRTPSAPNQIKLPPSIGRVPSSQASDDAGDMSDGSLFAHAIR